MERFFNMVMEAKSEALKNQIKANTILINENLAKTLPFLFCGNLIPAMICGLEIKFTNDLPDNVSFAVTEAIRTEREKLIEETKQETVKRIFGELIKSTTLCEAQGGHCSLDYLKVKASQNGAEFAGFDKDGNVIWDDN